jgi:pimeloyl-ACP methyl ester carboxylesterase
MHVQAQAAILPMEETLILIFPSPTKMVTGMLSHGLTHHGHGNNPGTSEEVASNDGNPTANHKINAKIPLNVPILEPQNKDVMARKIWRVIKISLLGFIGLLAFLIVCALSYRAIRQHENSAALAIHTPNGISEAMFVPMGGINQWITIQGTNRDNPVVLFLHGGPGTPTNLLDFSMAPAWTPSFTLVQWDQRGAGKTFGGGGTSATDMTIDRMSQDGIELAQFLRDYLHKEKIIIVGHSWGTILGIHMAKTRPDLFYAYVGAGQVVNAQENEVANYARVLGKARSSGDTKAITELQASGPPPYPAMKALTTQRIWAQVYEHADTYEAAGQANSLYAPGYSLLDLYHALQSIRFTLDTFIGPTMSGPAMKVDLNALGPDFAIPMFIFEAPNDYITSPELAKAYVDTLNASQKEFVMLPAGGHFAVFTHSEDFLKEMNAQVRPLASLRP